MELTAELLTQGLIGLLTVLGAVGVYLRTRQKPPPNDPVLAGVGAGMFEREQSERMIRALDRIAVAIETIADRRQSDMQETLHEIVEQMKKQQT